MTASDTAPTAKPSADDCAYQDHALQGVSRTFALTIPELPESLRLVVGNAYLLCRIADTLEDAESLSVDDKKRLSEQFVEVVAGTADAAQFGRDAFARLGDDTLEAERNLVRNTDRVLRITHGFSAADRAALLRCVRIMVDGMERFQEGRFTHGLRNEEQLDSYCYHVAGVVGEMLTELFCAHRPRIAERRAELERLAASFGQGLQMTNILKDIWDDRGRNVCWLPRDVFEQEGFDLRRIDHGRDEAAYQVALGRLVASAAQHLENALAYTLLIPRSEQGIRQFCLWALGMAVLTLRRINRRRDFASGSEVKISRRTVYATILISRLFGRSDFMLRCLFALLVRGLRQKQGPSSRYDMTDTSHPE